MYENKLKVHENKLINKLKITVTYPNREEKIIETSVYVQRHFF